MPHLGPTSSGIPGQLRSGTGRPLAKAAVRSTARPGFSFRLKPRELAAHLNRFVIGQTEAKKALSVALCDHFQHVRLSLEGNEAPFYQKQNVLLLGPTGVGKTHLLRSAADLIGVPFVKADATKFSETGYMGGDVDDLVRDLVRRAGGDAQRASYGIVYLDEVDKLATRDGAGRDVSGRGVQTNLLKIMEDGDVPLVSPNDVSGQLQAAMQAARGSGAAGGGSISTRHILFIASGAFSGLEAIVRRRLGNQSASGTSARLAAATTEDFIHYGLEPEFIGRLPVRVTCHALTSRHLFDVLQRSESSLIRQYERAFSAYGIRLAFREDALRRLAELAAGEATGARGLMTVLERVFRDLKFRLPSMRIRHLTITEEVINDPGVVFRRRARLRGKDGQP